MFVCSNFISNHISDFSENATEELYSAHLDIFHSHAHWNKL